jgi:hypothetical protein
VGVVVRMKRLQLSKATVPIGRSYSYLIQTRCGQNANGTYRVVVSDGVVSSAYRIDADGEDLVELHLDQDGLLVHVEFDQRTPA